MPKRKLLFPTPEYYKNLISEYCKEHKEELRKKVLRETGYEDMDALWDAEYHGKFGLTCGWVLIIPKNPDMRKEWARTLYNGECFISTSAAYNTQIIPIQEIILEETLEGLGIKDMFYMHDRLD